MNQRRVFFSLALVLVLMLVMVSTLLIRRPQQTLAQGPATTDAQPTALSAADSLQLTLQSQMPTSVPLNVYEGVVYSVQNLKVGAGASHPQAAREGWRWVSFDLIVENTNSYNVWLPSPNLDNQPWCNALIDSKGYTREFCIAPNGASMNPQTQDLHYPHEFSTLNDYYPLLLTPGVRIRLPAYVEIPAVSAPASVQILQNAQPVATLDLGKTSDALAVPFPDSVYTLLSAQTNPVLDLTTTTYHLKVSQCRRGANEFGGFLLVCSVSLENLGGDDLQVIPGMRQTGPVLFVVTANGDYGFTDMGKAPLSIGVIPPGATKTGTVTVGFFDTPAQVKWVWLALAASYGDVPVGRLIVSVK